MKTTPQYAGGIFAKKTAADAAGWPRERSSNKMAKRFTCSDKWVDKWFRKLPPALKLGWLYLIDNCDAAGVIELDEELADFQIGQEVDWQDLIDRSRGRIQMLESGRLWLTKFVQFQYGELKPGCAPHRAVLKALEKHDLLETEAVRVALGYEYPKATLTANSDTLTANSDTLTENSERDKEKDKDKEEDKDKERVKEGESEGEPYTAEFEEFWEAFPRGRRKSKGAAFTAWQKAKLKVPPKSLVAYAREYAESPEGQGDYVKMPSTWLNQECWNDDRAAWQGPARNRGDPRHNAAVIQDFINEDQNDE